MRYFQSSDRIFQTRADVIVFALYLILADSARQSTVRHFSLQKIQQNNHLRTQFWGTYENFRPGSQTVGVGGAAYAPHCTYQITGLPSVQTPICLRVLSAACWAWRMPAQGQGKPLYLITMLRILITLLPWKHKTVKEQLLGEHRAAGGAISAFS